MSYGPDHGDQRVRWRAGRAGGLASAGQIARLWGLRDVRIGDVIGGAPPPGALGGGFMIATVF